MREYTASLLFIHPTFGVWANRKELFLLRIAQKGINFFSPFGQYVYLCLFQQELTHCPSGFRKKEKNILIMISDHNSPHCRCPYQPSQLNPVLPCPALPVVSSSLRSVSDQLKCYYSEEEKKTTMVSLASGLAGLLLMFLLCISVCFIFPVPGSI